MREMSVEALEAVASRAVQAGVFPSTWNGTDRYAGRIRRFLRWDISGKCESPCPVELFARYSCVGAGRRMLDGRVAKPMTVVLDTRCRRCGWCKIQRRHLWANKARTEWGQASRTWFLTLTMRPEEHYRMLSTARLAVANFDSLPHDKRFAALVRCAGPELTRFIKRVRKNSGVRLRYLLVAEPHKSGLPHFHMLVHEKGAPVRKTVLKAAWRLGFMKASLSTDERSALYLCKYLAKEASTRVRASFGYGQLVDPYAVEQHSEAWPQGIVTPRAAAGGPGAEGAPENNKRAISPHYMGVVGVFTPTPGFGGAAPVRDEIEPSLRRSNWTETDEVFGETVNGARPFSRSDRSGSAHAETTVQEHGILEPAYDGSDISSDLPFEGALPWGW